jgi:hypothetical protein
MDRQAILARESPPLLWCVIDEAVLRRPVGLNSTESPNSNAPQAGRHAASLRSTG